ncbi:MAG TPA: phosphatase PAP2 family protein [Micropepsaceae bacterium]|nr:phosphatase PAP2 family protein [Micropepsaceae bacterium]
MLLVLAILFLIAGLLFFRIDRKSAHWCRENLDRPLFQYALRVTDWAKGLPWIIAALLAWLVVQLLITFSRETPLLREISDYSLALLASFIVASVILHSIKIFLGRRRPRDEFQHGLYGFRYFTWQLQYDSFPSGHAMTIFCVAVIVSAIWPVLTPVWLFLATCLALTRAMLTAHFFSDVLVGAAIGLIISRETLLMGFPALAPSWF